MKCDPRDGLIHLGESTSLDGAAEHHFGAEVVPCRVELECVLLKVQLRELGLEPRRSDGANAAAGQHERELLHVALGVAPIDAERVQLHELPGVVFVDMPGRILIVIEIRHHRGVLERRQHQVLEPA